MSANEKVIDAIWIKSRLEAYLIQITVAESHSITDFNYLLAIRSILSNKIPSIRVSFVVVVPADGHFAFTERQINSLKAANMPFAAYRITAGLLKQFKVHRKK